jgi:hypothetical protein
VSSYLVIQLYCTPAEANDIRSALTAEVAKYSEYTDSRIEFEPKTEAEADSGMHSEWATQHPGQDPADRGYFFLRVESPTDIPEPALREVENTVTDWIDTTYNDVSDEIVEVQWGSYAGTRLVN